MPPHAGKQSGIGQLEIFEYRGDRIRQSNSVQNAILFHPHIQGIPVRCACDCPLPVAHDPISWAIVYPCSISFLCQIDIGGTNAGGVLIILIPHQLLYCQFLCLCRETASQPNSLKFQGNTFRPPASVACLPDAKEHALLIVIIHTENTSLTIASIRNIIHRSIGRNPLVSMVRPAVRLVNIPKSSYLGCHKRKKST